MNLLYVTFLEDSALYLGVKKKILAQTRAFEKLGYTVTYSMWKGQKFAFYGEIPDSFYVDESRRRMRRFCEIVKYFLTKHPFDLLYIRLDRLSFDTIELLKATKAKRTKVIVEIPNYPYLSDYLKNAGAVSDFEERVTAYAKTLLSAADDLLSRPRLKHVADAVVLIGNQTSEFCGMPVQNIENGVDVDAFPPLPPADPGRTVSFIGVAGTLWWQGYERLLQGIRNYIDAHPNSAYSFRFQLVGGDPKEMPQFAKTVADLRLEDRVNCVGFQSGEALYRCYREANIGVSSLGCYKRGLTRCSSLKSREYAALGLPFLYAYDDPAVDNQPFALKLPNDPTPVDLERVLAFWEDFYAHPEMRTQEIEYAKARFDWTGILRGVLERAGIGGQ